MTIKDVAQLAGVSIATVSNTLSGRKNVSEKNKKAVLDAAKELGFVPNINAQLMKGRHTGNLGLFLPYMEGPFYAELMPAVYYACQQAGYALFIHVEDDTDSKRAISSILSCNIDGAIVLNDHLHDEEITLINKRGIPLVFMDRELCGKSTSSVILNNESGTVRQVEYMIHTGHKHIAYMRGQDNYDGLTRYAAFRKAMEKYHMPIDEQLILTGSFDFDVAYAITRALCRSKVELPDALICANDRMALGAIKAFGEMQVNVPGRVSVIGFDDLGNVETSRPPLTTVGYSMREYASMAVRELVRLINEPGAEGRIQVMDTHPVIRDSAAIRYNGKLD